MIKEIAIYFAAIYCGWMTGLFGALVCSIWICALYSVVGEGRRHGLSSPARFPPGVAIKRFIIRMPLIVIAHPLPWVLVGVGYLGYLLMAKPMNSGQFTLAVSVLGGFVYEVFHLVFPFKEQGSK